MRVVADGGALACLNRCVLAALVAPPARARLLYAAMKAVATNRSLRFTRLIDARVFDSHPFTDLHSASASSDSTNSNSAFARPFRASGPPRAWSDAPSTTERSGIAAAPPPR